MENSHPRLSQGSWRAAVFGGVALLVIIADQLIKNWIRTNLAAGQVLWDKGWVEIVYVQNTGASFGILQGRTLLIIIAVFIEIAIVLLFIWLLHRRWTFLNSMTIHVGTGLILGGAIGNQIDRLALGRVTDFIDFKWWPAFNVADASAVVGAFIVAYCILFLSGLGKHKKV